MTSPPLRSAWADLRLREPSNSAEGFRLKLLDATPEVRVYAAWSAAATPGILIEFPVEARRQNSNLISSRAFAIQSAAFPGLGSERTGVMITLRDIQFDDLFTILATEVVASVLATTTAPEAHGALRRVVDRWRHFVERGRSSLSDERIRGLIGELVVLSRIVAKFGAREALLAWKGPHDALRDFELPDQSVEVKAFQSDAGTAVRISNPQQLDVVQGRPVFLVAVQLARVSASGKALPQFVASLNSLCSSAIGGLELLEGKLAEYGYLPAHAPQYVDAFVIEKVLAFGVRDDFPRIKPASIVPGVRDVQYSVELSALTQFATNPVDLLGSPDPLVES